MIPQGKVDVVRQWGQLNGKVVGMCGDGGNDSGALAAAHVGVSLLPEGNEALHEGTKEAQVVHEGAPRTPSTSRASIGSTANPHHSHHSGTSSASSRASDGSPAAAAAVAVTEEVSVVAPFASSTGSISSIVDLVEEGRCVLEGSTAVCHFFVVIGLLSGAGKVLFLGKHAFASELTFLLADGILVNFLSYMMAHGSRPKKFVTAGHTTGGRSTSRDHRHHPTSFRSERSRESLGVGVRKSSSQGLPVGGQIISRSSRSHGEEEIPTRLYPTQPTASVVSFESLTSIATAFVLNYLVLFLLFALLEKQLFFQAFNQNVMQSYANEWWLKNSSFYAGTIFVWTTFSMVGTAVFFQGCGGRFRRFCNVYLWAGCLLPCLLAIVLLFTNETVLNCGFRVNCSNDASWNASPMFLLDHFVASGKEVYSSGVWMKRVDTARSSPRNGEAMENNHSDLELELEPAASFRHLPLADLALLSAAERAASRLDGAPPATRVGWQECSDYVKQERNTFGEFVALRAPKGFGVDKSVSACVVELPTPPYTGPTLEGAAGSRKKIAAEEHCHAMCAHSWKTILEGQRVRAKTRFYCHWSVVDHALKTCFLLPRTDFRTLAALGPEPRSFEGTLESDQLGAAQRRQGAEFLSPDRGNGASGNTGNLPKQQLALRRGSANLNLYAVFKQNKHNVMGGFASGWGKEPPAGGPEKTRSVYEQPSLGAPGNVKYRWYLLLIAAASVFLAAVVKAWLLDNVAFGHKKVTSSAAA